MRLPLISLLALGSCSSLDEMRLANESNPGPCPNVFVLQDAARFVEFNGDEQLSSVAWSGEVTDVRSSCRYAEDTPIRARLEIDFAVGKGPAAEGASFPLTYFVAVTRRDRDLIAKEEFTVPVTVNREGVASVRLTEQVNDILIPRLGEQTSGTNFEIAVGFALSREQVVYNRSGRSLKFPELDAGS